MNCIVSLILPIRNEEQFIDRCLQSILIQDYPQEKMEVLLVDGMSEDRTREMIEGYCRKYPNFRLLDNPQRIVPTAMNIAIKAARGEVIIRMDAHAGYPPEYVSMCFKILQETGADNVGGPCYTLPPVDTLMAQSIALATSHPFGVGNCAFRTKKEAGYVDTVPYGCFRRELFDRIGLYDERLVRNQDNELNSRIIKAGGKIYMTPEINVYYYNQGTLKGLLRQASFTGMWNAFTQYLHPYTFKIRYQIPALFFLGTTFCMILIVSGLWFLSPFWFLSGLILLMPYLGTNIAVSSTIAAREGWLLLFLLPIVFFSYHYAYGYGVVKGWLMVVTGFWKRFIPA